MGISFAIPIDVAMDVVAQLKARGHVSRGKIGVVIQELSQDLAASFGLAKPAGALINAVEPNGPAAKAGVKPGDIIQQVDGKPVESGSDLQRLIGSIPPGKPVTLGLWRNRAATSAKVVPVEQQDQDPRLAQREYRGSQQERPNEQSFSQIGLRLQVLNPAQLQRAGIKYGLLVRGANNVAMRAGIQPGDVIVGIGSEPLANVEQLKSALSAAKKGSSIALQVLRQGITQFIPLPVGDGK